MKRICGLIRRKISDIAHISGQIIAVVICGQLVLAAPAARGQGLSADEAVLLLQIGGIGLRKGTIQQPGWQNGGLRAGAACDRLDISGGVRDFVEQTAAGAENLRNQAYRSATASISGLPWLSLRRALPEVADLFDAELARGEQKSHRIRSLCEREVKEPAPKDWNQAARSQLWNIAGQLAATPEQASEMAQEAPDRGVQWLDEEMRGGSGQEPIFVVSETVRAGARLLLPDAELLATGWSSYAQAAQWAVDVLGDIRVRLDESTDSALPGSGLWPQVRQASRALRPALEKAVDNRRIGQPVTEQMQVLRAGQSGMSIRLLDEISRSGGQWRKQAIARLAYELAISHTLDRALLTRQFLLTGVQRPEIAALKPAEQLITERLQQLEAEVQALLFEYRARQSLGETMSDIWQASHLGSQSR